MLFVVSYKVNSNALVAQLDRATDYESVGRAFESLQAHQTLQALTRYCKCLFVFGLKILRNFRKKTYALCVSCSLFFSGITPEIASAFWPISARATLQRALVKRRWMVPRETPMHTPASSWVFPSPSQRCSVSSSSCPS